MSEIHRTTLFHLITIQCSTLSQIVHVHVVMVDFVQYIIVANPGGRGPGPPPPPEMLKV